MTVYRKCAGKAASLLYAPLLNALLEPEAGAKTADLVRKHGVSAATLYSWKAKYGGLEVS